MNIRILSIALLFGFGVQTGFAFDQEALAFVKQHKRLPKASEIGKKAGDSNQQLIARLKDLSGADLRSRSDMMNAQLAGGNLSNAKLGTNGPIATNWSGSDFSAADLTNASLNQSHFDKAKFNNAKLVNASLASSQSNRPTTFTNTDFTKADLTGSQLVLANLTGAILTGTILKQINLLKATLTGATYDGLPVTKQWLKDQGALHVDTVIGIN